MAASVYFHSERNDLPQSVNISCIKGRISIAKSVAILWTASLTNKQSEQMNEYRGK